LNHQRSMEPPPPSLLYPRPQPPHAQSSPPLDPPHARLQRNPSSTNRPTSELPSADDMNAVRAKESWEMERLWKARSMYGLEPNAQTNNFIPGPSSSTSSSDDLPPLPVQGGIYGSSHTAYVVQAGFHNSSPGSQIYHSMPVAPPPIIYSSPASIPSIPDSISSYGNYEQYRPFRAPSPPLPPMPLPVRNNPLPEPPRESSYAPAPLPSARHNKKHSNDYWKFNGITTAH